MPVHPSVPEPLKGALEQMELLVQSFKRDLPFKAPEQHDEVYGALQMDLATNLSDLYERVLRDAKEASG